MPLIYNILGGDGTYVPGGANTSSQRFAPVGIKYKIPTHYIKGVWAAEYRPDAFPFGSSLDREHQ